MRATPVQNLGVFQEWIGTAYFSFILSTDLVVDVFFWIGAFLASY